MFCIGWEVGVVVNAGGEEVSLGADEDGDEAGADDVEDVVLAAELDEAGEDDDWEDDGVLL